MIYEFTLNKKVYNIIAQSLKEAIEKLQLTATKNMTYQEIFLAYIECTNIITDNNLEGGE